MASALAALANATATFQVASTGVTTDAATGNVVPNAASVTASLFLKESNVETQLYPGVDVVRGAYQGYVTGGVLDSRVRVGTEGTLTFAGGAAVTCEVRALRQPYGKTGLLGEVLGSVLGAQIILTTSAQS